MVLPQTAKAIVAALLRASTPHTSEELFVVRVSCRLYGSPAITAHRKVAWRKFALLVLCGVIATLATPNPLIM